MKHVAAYLLAVLGGNENPSAADIKKILSSVNVEADDAKLEKLLSELRGKNLQELIEAGRSKLAAVPTGGAAAAPSGGAPSSGAPSGGKVDAAPKRDDTPPAKEEKEESEEGLGFDLFD